MGVHHARIDYSRLSLSEVDLKADPISQFHVWFEEAWRAGVPEPGAMTLATATPQGRPSARIVLLRRYDERGFVFYTNYESRKGRELRSNPYAALVFLWHELERQVRIEGQAQRVSSEESDAYFQSRPALSRLGAWVSRQSDVIASRQSLELSFKTLQQYYPNDQIPRPEFWGGYRVVPESVEFWQGRSNRLHDRLRYRREHGTWVIERLSP